MAEALGTTQPTVSRWLAISRRMPAQFVILAEQLTGVSRHDLRPDIYPREQMVDHRAGSRFLAVDLPALAGQRESAQL